MLGQVNYPAMFRAQPNDAERAKLYKKLAMKLHPNKNPKTPEGEFVRMSAAYKAHMASTSKRSAFSISPISILKKATQIPNVILILRRIVSPLIARADNTWENPTTVSQQAYRKTHIQHIYAIITCILLSMVSIAMVSMTLHNTYTTTYNNNMTIPMLRSVFSYILSFLTYKQYQSNVKRLHATKSWMSLLLKHNTRNSPSDISNLTSKTSNVTNSNNKLIVSMPEHVKSQLWNIGQRINTSSMNRNFIRNTCEKFGLTTEQAISLGKKIAGGPPPRISKRQLGIVNVITGTVLVLGNTSIKQLMRRTNERRVLQNTRQWMNNYKRTMTQLQQQTPPVNWANFVTQLGRHTRHGRGHLEDFVYDGKRIPVLKHPVDYEVLPNFERSKMRGIEATGMNIRNKASAIQASQMGLIDPASRVSKMHIQPKFPATTQTSLGSVNNFVNNRFSKALNADMLGMRSLRPDHLTGLLREAISIATGTGLCKSTSMFPRSVAHTFKWWQNYNIGWLLDLTSAERRGMVHHIYDRDSYTPDPFPFGQYCMARRQFKLKTYDEVRKRTINKFRKPILVGQTVAVNEINIDIDSDSVLGVLFKQKTINHYNGKVWGKEWDANQLFETMNQLSILGETIAKTFNVPNFLGVFYTTDYDTQSIVRLRTYEDVLKYFPYQYHTSETS
jgi:hypothetical protein